MERTTTVPPENTALKTAQTLPPPRQSGVEVWSLPPNHRTHRPRTHQQRYQHHSTTTIALVHQMYGMTAHRSGG